MRTATVLAPALALSLAAQLAAQQPAQPTPQQVAQQQQRERTAADHRDMMQQLGIRALRPGPSGDENAPNHANYDEALANPYPNLPEVLTLKNGTKVTTPEMWWNQRRPEIVEDFEREVLGRVPPNVPKVNWQVAETTTARLGDREVRAKRLVGRVDNSSYPQIEVNIEMMVVTPANALGPVPVMMMFGRGAMPGAPAPAGKGAPKGNPNPNADPPSTQQLIASGWGYAYLNPTSVQADNGAGLTEGIIGLVNKGQRRKPDDWGSLRAWAWGASRGLDYLETDATVDAKRVGIEGVSRYGKAALVTMAFDTRFAVVLIGSSGEGGVKLHRRNFGEAVENLTGSGEYHWMAGNFLKYGASEAAFGSMNPGDIPVDAHELLALCAPRPTFISYGVPEKGDAKWLDQQGSFMAAIAAQPVYRLLGAKDLGRSDDYKTEKMPDVNVSLLDGQLAWRQHDGGHTDGPNWRYFIPWADKMLGRPLNHPVARTDQNSRIAHEQLLAKKTQGRIDVYFEGDSIARRWGATDYPELLAHWNKTFHGWNAADFAWGADRVENILWRLNNGELDGVNPKVIVLQAGTNNVSDTKPGQEEAKAAEIAAGLRRVIETMRDKAPGATVIVTGIFARTDRPALMPAIQRVNRDLAQMADGKRVRYVNVKFANGALGKDGLHPALPGYEAWGAALKPMLTEVLGAPAKEDHAPPPTGDPSARR